MKPDQVDALKKSFTQIESVGKEAGRLFYQTLFERNPAFQTMFTGDIDQQVEKFLATLKLIVYSFESTPNGAYHLSADLREPLLNLGKKHQQLGVTTDMFNPVAVALMVSLEKFLGNSFTPELRQAWIDAYWEIAAAMNGTANYQ